MSKEEIEDTQRLRKLYMERVPKDMSQAEFGSVYGIGTQGMVWQYLNGYRVLNIEATAKFARGLRCTIADISPNMARQLKAEIFPVLGKISTKAVLILSLLMPFLLPTDAHAGSKFDITFTPITIVCALRRIWCRLFARSVVS